MSLRILSITLLVLSTCLCCQSSTLNWRLAGRKYRPCCTKAFTDNISSAVTEDTYREQSAKPPCVEAIILTTHRGPVCVHPNTTWVKKLTANMTKL